MQSTPADKGPCSTLSNSLDVSSTSFKVIESFWSFIIIKHAASTVLKEPEDPKPLARGTDDDIEIVKEPSGKTEWWRSKNFWHLNKNLAFSSSNSGFYYLY